MQFSLLTLFRGFLTLILVATSIADDCEYCTKITDRFTESLQKTAHKGFSGGNTHWEETNIGSYATSEVRFHDIIDSLCANSDNAWCFGILDTLEPIMHTWWTSVFKVNHTGIHSPRDIFCVTAFNYCCPFNHFGPECDVCAPCSRPGGSCVGNGTRTGSGLCSCDVGYTGDLCDKCNLVTHFEDKLSDVLTVCKACHVSCTGGCWNPDATGCNECAVGWAAVLTDEGQQICEDVDECEQHPCNSSFEYCVNTPGSFECRICSSACVGCNGPKTTDCIECRDGYHFVEGECVDIDECNNTDTSPCQQNGQICRNIVGGYVCDCQNGFEKHGELCVQNAAAKTSENQKKEVKAAHKTSKLVWSTEFVTIFSKYVGSLFAFVLFCWFAKGHLMVSLLACFCLGVFIYHQSVNFDGLLSK